MFSPSASILILVVPPKSGAPVGLIAGVAVGVSLALLLAFAVYRYLRSRIDLSKLPDDVRWFYQQYYDSPNGNLVPGTDLLTHLKDGLHKRAE